MTVLTDIHHLQYTSKIVKKMKIGLNYSYFHLFP